MEGDNNTDQYNDESGQKTSAKQNSKQPPTSNKDKFEIDPFVLNSIYPDAGSIFSSWLKPLSEIKKDCYVILDASVLLDPYNYKTLDFIEGFVEESKKVLGPLANQGRLIIPGQAAREFAKNRGFILAEVYNNLLSFTTPQPTQQVRSSLLSSLSEYKEFSELIHKSNQQISKINPILDKLKSQVQGWKWDDPISKLYNELFTSNVILDWPLEKDKQTILDDFNRRFSKGIPPIVNTADRKKDDGGIGDLLIWHSILHIGETKKQSVIFVSGDIKADWWYSTAKDKNRTALYPRFELVDEFRRISGGKSFHIVKFSELLKLFGAEAKIVEELQEEEQKVLNNYLNTEEDILIDDPYALGVRVWHKRYGKGIVVKRLKNPNSKNHDLIVKFDSGQNRVIPGRLGGFYPGISTNKDFKAGDMVVHPRFGKGFVVTSLLIGDDEEVTVAFEGPKGGIKKLIASVAHLRKLPVYDPEEMEPEDIPF